MVSVDEYRMKRKGRLVNRFYHEDDLAEKLRLAVVLHRLQNEMLRQDGGPGSGNWGHEGVQGHWGGSTPGGGVHNRQTTESGSYTSFSKIKAAAAKSHATSLEELQSLPAGSVVYDTEGNEYTKMADGKNGNFEVHGPGTYDIYDAEFAMEWLYDDVKISIPDDANPNYNVDRTTSRREYERRFNEAYTAVDAAEYDEIYREQSGEIWNSLNDEEKSSLGKYTGGGYTIINTALRSGEEYKLEKYSKDIENITNSINQSEMKEDTVLYRGVGTDAIENMFKLESGSLTPEKMESLIGKTGTEDGFMSCGSSVGTGFNNTVKIEILAPEGTKALYVEPFSTYGDGFGSHWDSRLDGKEKQDVFSDEDETLVQRGSSIQIISAESYFNEHWGYYNYNVKAVIVNQKYNN